VKLRNEQRVQLYVAHVKRMRILLVCLQMCCMWLAFFSSEHAVQAGAARPDHGKMSNPSHKVGTGGSVFIMVVRCCMY
jgi:hypothetical protein